MPTSLPACRQTGKTDGHFFFRHFCPCQAYPQLDWGYGINSSRNPEIEEPRSKLRGFSSVRNFIIDIARLDPAPRRGIAASIPFKPLNLKS